MSIVIALGILVTLATGFPVVLQMRKHPKGLFILFFAEMWERFSYYGMRAILIFYLTQHFLYDDKYSGGLFGAYTSLVYLLPLVGGLIADRWLGTRKAIAFGALLLVAGHLTMAIEGKPAEQTLAYAGKTYEFRAQGRGDERTVALMVDGKGYAFGPKPTPGLLITGAPVTAALPATLGETSYKLSEPEKVSGPNAIESLMGMFGREVEETVSSQTLTYKGVEYAVTKREKGEESASTVLIAGTAYPIAPPKGGLVINDLPATASLPAVLDDGDYKLDVRGRNPTYTGIFFLALSLIIMGVGFLKPNISTIVGQLYPQGDPRRDPGFTLYYYGINLGAFWASILCVILGQNYGWWAGFGLAGVGMLAGYIVFVLGKPLLQGKGEPPNPEALAKPVVGPMNREHLIYVAGLLGVSLVWFMVQRNALVGGVLGLSIVVSLAFITWFLIFKCDKVQRERMMLALVLILGAVVFFTLFEQAGTSLNLFAARNVDLTLISAPITLELFGKTIFIGSHAMASAPGVPSDILWIDAGIAAGQTQSFNAGFILIFAPVFASMWLALSRINKDPNPVMKFGLGLIQVGLGFMVLVWGAGMANSAFQMPLMMLGFLYLLHTTGELFLSPVGLSEVTKLSVASVVSFMMAVWFLSSSIAQYVGGWIAGLAGTETVGGQVLDPAGALATSLGVFGKLGWAGIIIGAVFVLISFVVKQWAHGVNDAANHAAPEIDGDRQSMPH